MLKKADFSYCAPGNEIPSTYLIQSLLHTHVHIFDCGGVKDRQKKHKSQLSKINILAF